MRSQALRLSLPALLTASLIWLSPSAWAADPFRTASEARTIGPQTELAFQALFQQGNYPQAERYLESALRSGELSDPLTFSLLAAMAYLKGDWNGFRGYTSQTQQVAVQLTPRDPLRGNLYQAVAAVMEATYDVSDAGNGLVLGMPKALSKVQQMFRYLDRAAAVNPQDPELNLLKGYIDLLLASDLALVSPKQAIDRLQAYAAPPYLAQRGIAIAYRDLEQYPAALTAVDQALQSAPDNPELLLLKAQILRLQGQAQASAQVFDQALAKQGQLPEGLAQQIRRERSQLQL